MSQYWSMTEGAFNCLVDRQRTQAFQRVIRKTVDRNCVVADLGSGSGIMALFAASAGAKKVYAVEHDEKYASRLERSVALNGFGGIIEVIHGDARTVRLPQKVDVIICEMIATGLLEELQIPVMNHALSYARKGTRVILQKILNYVDAVEVDDRFYGFQLPVPQYDYPGEDLVRVQARTPKYLYREVDFTRKNATRVDVTVTLPVRSKTKRGKINGIRITNRTGFCDGSFFGASSSYCFPAILPVEPLAVKIGDKVAIKLSYDMCCGFSTLRVAATQV